MTKYLVKIISICTFIVLIPVIIAGVALCAVGSTLHKLNIYVVGADNANASYSITVGEKDKDKKEAMGASFLKDTDVNVAVTSVVGYDFQGWYNGDDKTYLDETAPLSTDESYTFVLKGDTQLTAVFASKTYTIKFTGKYDDETTDIEIADKTVKYGDAITTLETPVAKEQGTTFVGWKVVGKSYEPTNVATFETSGEYIVEPVWSDRARVNYILKDGDTETVFDYEYVTASGLANFSLPTEDDEKVKEAVGKGYTFVKWSNQAGQTMTNDDFRNQTFDKTAVYNVYLNRELIQYTLKVKASEDATTTTDVTFNIEDMFGDIAIERTYYTLVGLKVNGKTYLVDGNDFVEGGVNRLSTKLINETATTIEAVAVWECNYKTLPVTYSALSNGSAVYGFNGTDYELLVDDFIDGQDSNTFNFADNTAGAYDLTDLMFSTIFPTTYTNYYIDGEIEGQYVKVNLTKVNVYFNGAQCVTITDLTQADFAYAIELVLAENEDYNFFTQSLVVEFVFA